MMILSPKGAATERSIPLMPPIGDLRGRTVGFINNGHHNGTPVLEAMREILLSRYGVAKVLFRTKPRISLPASEEMVQEMRGSCDTVIAGVGD